MYNEICISLPRCTTLSDNRQDAISDRLDNGYTADDFKRLFQMAEDSAFLKGRNKRNWRANIDWLISDANMPKVLEGMYTDDAPEIAGAYNYEALEKQAFRRVSG